MRWITVSRSRVSRTVESWLTGRRDVRGDKATSFRAKRSQLSTPGLSSRGPRPPRRGPKDLASVLEEPVAGQIVPAGIARLNQSELPLPRPSLDLLLAFNRRPDVRGSLEVDQPDDSIPRGESRKSSRPVLPHATNQVARNADVQPSREAGEDIHRMSAAWHAYKGATTRSTVAQPCQVPQSMPGRLDPSGAAQAP